MPVRLAAAALLAALVSIVFLTSPAKSGHLPEQFPAMWVKTVAWCKDLDDIIRFLDMPDDKTKPKPHNFPLRWKMETEAGECFGNWRVGLPSWVDEVVGGYMWEQDPTKPVTLLKVHTDTGFPLYTFFIQNVDDFKNTFEQTVYPSTSDEL